MRTVRADIPVRVWLPDAEELAQLEYRSKLELTENVRIVEIGDIDRCACCAPHIAHRRGGRDKDTRLVAPPRRRARERRVRMDAVEDYRSDAEPRDRGIARAERKARRGRCGPACWTRREYAPQGARGSIERGVGTCEG